MSQAKANSILRRIIIALGFLGAALVLATVVEVVALGLTWKDLVDGYVLTNVVIGCGLLGSGMVIGWNVPRNAVGWILLVGGVGHVISAVLAPLIPFGIEHGWSVELTRLVSTVFLSSWQLGLSGLFPLALLLFPDGKYPSPRWRPLGWMIVGLTGVQIVTGLLSDGNLFDVSATRSVFSIGLLVPDAARAALGALTAGVILLTVLSLVIRYIKGTELARRQLLWLILAVLAMLVINSQRWLTGDGPILPLLSFVFVPIAIAVAVVRHHLLDIRLAVSRTVLYLTVSVIAIAVYAGLVAGLSFMVPAEAGRGVAVASALVVAIGFNPLRVFLQKLIGRIFYGTRADPVGTASRLGEQLGSNDDVEGLLEHARDALRLPSLALERGGRVVASAGEALDGGPVVRVPLMYRGAQMGALMVGLRRGDSILHPADRRIVTLVATPLSIALYSTDLVAQLQASRAAIVGAREEERLRLHRDLHDGLGPVLTGAAFLTDAAGNRLRNDPDEAESLLAEVRAGIRQALDDVRRIVYGLRPLELEERGLLGALQQRLSSLQRNDGVRLQVVFDTVEVLPSLSAAVELAAYRIASEGVTNVVRHSNAGSCIVKLRAGESLTIEISDDGAPGKTPWRQGVGLRSIAERAEELGGHAEAGPTLTGGRVFAELPLPDVSTRWITAAQAPPQPPAAAARHA